MFTLSPATRFGYFTYPAGLLGWLAIVRTGLTRPLRGAGPPALAEAAEPVSVPAGPLA